MGDSTVEDVPPRERSRPSAAFTGCTFGTHVLAARPADDVLMLDALTHVGNLDPCRDDPRFSSWHGNDGNGDLVHDFVQQADAVVHSAPELHVARPINDNSPAFLTDVIGTQIIASAVAKSDKFRVALDFSTFEVYGTAAEERMSESRPLGALSSYAGTKTGANPPTYSCRPGYGFPAVIIRPPNNDRPHQHLEKVVPSFITSALDGKPMTVLGEGPAPRDWLYVDYAAEALALLLEHEPPQGPSGIHNLGTGRAAGVLEIAGAVCLAAGRDCETIQYMCNCLGRLPSTSRMRRASWRGEGGAPTCRLRRASSAPCAGTGRTKRGGESWSR